MKLCRVFLGLRCESHPHMNDISAAITSGIHDFAALCWDTAFVADTVFPGWSARFTVQKQATNEQPSSFINIFISWAEERTTTSTLLNIFLIKFKSLAKFAHSIKHQKKHRETEIRRWQICFESHDLLVNVINECRILLILKHQTGGGFTSWWDAGCWGGPPGRWPLLHTGSLWGSHSTSSLSHRTWRKCLVTKNWVRVGLSVCIFVW